MGDKTGIEWTGATWNPVTGCAKVSQGCKNCYALRDWARLSAPRTPPNVYTGRAFTDVGVHPERLDQPIKWTKPRLIFVNSMSDLFHDDVPDEFIDRVFAVMALAPQHTFQVLTKRPERMQRYMTGWPDGAARFHHVAAQAHQIKPGMKHGLPDGFAWELQKRWPLPNVWLGVSVENQETADERIPLLLKTPAAVRWLSMEPLLGRVDLKKWMGIPYRAGGWLGDDNPLIDWVVVGGESGPKARPFDVAWARSIIGQCKAAGTPVFMKQLGAQPRGWCAWHTPECVGKEEADRMRAEDTDGLCDHYEASEQAQPCDSYSRRCMVLKDRSGGDPQEWPEDLRVREYPR